MTRPAILGRTLLGFAVTGVAVLTSAARPALAQDHPAHALPAEAYAACTSKAEGAACTVALHGRAFQGVCASDRNTPQLACRPSPPRPR